MGKSRGRMREREGRRGRARRGKYGRRKSGEGVEG